MYSHIVVIGCCAHTHNLPFADFMKQPSVEELRKSVKQIVLHCKGDCCTETDFALFFFNDKYCLSTTLMVIEQYFCLKTTKVERTRIKSKSFKHGEVQIENSSFVRKRNCRTVECRH